MNLRSLCFDTEGFTIGTLSADDRALFCQLFTDEQTMTHIGPAMSEESANSLFESALRANQRQPARDLFWVICSKHAGTGVGICTLQRIQWESRCGEIGIMLTPARQNRRVAREVLSALILALFQSCGLRSLKASYHPNNVGAERLFVALGFTRTNEMSHNSSARVVLLTIEDWRASKSNANASMSMG